MCTKSIQPSNFLNKGTSHISNFLFQHTRTFFYDQERAVQHVGMKFQFSHLTPSVATVLSIVLSNVCHYNISQETVISEQSHLKKNNYRTKLHQLAVYLPWCAHLTTNTVLLNILWFLSSVLKSVTCNVSWTKLHQWIKQPSDTSKVTSAFQTLPWCGCVLTHYWYRAVSMYQCVSSTLTFQRWHLYNTLTGW